jgi:Ras family protein
MSNNGRDGSVAMVHRKLAVLGFRAVGKSSLANSFVTGSFSEAYDPTIECTLHKTIRFRKVHFATDLVDTAGMDEFSRLSRNASLGCHGYVLVFNITSRNSFDRIAMVNDFLLTTLGDAPDVPRVLVGSMRDLEGHRQVSEAEAQSLADKWGIPYLECSAKTGHNVAEVFHALLREIEKDDGLLKESNDGGCILL